MHSRSKLLATDGGGGRLLLAASLALLLAGCGKKKGRGGFRESTAVRICHGVCPATRA